MKRNAMARDPETHLNTFRWAPFLPNFFLLPVDPGFGHWAATGLLSTSATMLTASDTKNLCSCNCTLGDRQLKPSNCDAPATPIPMLNACHNETCMWPFLIYYQTHIKTIHFFHLLIINLKDDVSV